MMRSIQPAGRKKHRQAFVRPTRGATIVELGAAIALLIPFIILASYIAVSVMQVCVVKSILNQSASTAARKLAVAYADSPEQAITDPESIFNDIRFKNVVITSEQFEIPPGSAGWNLYSNPRTITVSVKFHSGQMGLPTLPNPDPLGLSSGFALTSTATANLN